MADLTMFVRQTLRDDGVITTSTWTLTPPTLDGKVTVDRDALVALLTEAGFTCG